MFKFIGDNATQKQMEKAEKEKGGVCPFTFHTGAAPTMRSTPTIKIIATNLFITVYRLLSFRIALSSVDLGNSGLPVYSLLLSESCHPLSITRSGHIFKSI